MTTMVATADPRPHTRSAHPRTHITSTTAPRPSRLEAKETVSCPACGRPATVEARDMLAGTSGPVVHLQLRCPVGRHWFCMPEDGVL